MKASMFDVMYFGIAALVLGVGILVAAIVMTALQTSTAGSLDSAEAVATMANGVAAIQVFDYTFILIVGGLIFASMIGAFIIPSHPIMILPAVILLVIFLMIVPILSNTYETIEGNDAFVTEAANYGLISFVMNNLPIIGTVFGGLLLVAMYTRWQNPGTI